MELLECEEMGLQSHVLFLAPSLPTNPSLPFHPAQGGQCSSLNILSPGAVGRDSQERKAPQPTALSNVDAGTLPQNA